MITINVLSCGEEASALPMSVTFDETGGHIGRSESNQLVLPDSRRSVSRVHAQVVFRAGRYFVVDCGSNPMTHNGRPLGYGQEAVLQLGDELQIGSYRLGVSATAQGGSAVMAHLCADFAGLASSAPAIAVAPQPKPPAHVPEAVPHLSATAADGDFFASNHSPALVPRSESTRCAPQTAHTSSGDGLDTLFGLGSVSSACDPYEKTPGRSQVFSSPSGGLAQSDRSGGALKSIDGGPPPQDNLFLSEGLTRSGGASAAADTCQQEEELLMRRPSSPFNPAAHKQQTRSSPNHHAQTDSTPFDNTPAHSARALGSAQTSKAVLTPIPDAVLSWELSGQTGHTVVVPAHSAKDASCSPAHEKTPGRSQVFLTPLGGDLAQSDRSGGSHEITPGRSQVLSPPLGDLGQSDRSGGDLKAIAEHPQTPKPIDEPAVASVLAQRPAVSAALSEEALLDALRQGLGMPELPLRSLTPELMRLIGRLLHEATQGTVDLLVARSVLKREIRADVTIIQARENNPLKFSPSAEVALKHMLSPPSRGFIGPEAAFRDAFQDLRAHQLGFVAGLRAVIEGLLEHFDPQKLENHIAAQRSVIANLVPAARKARLWDAYEQMYTQIVVLAQDDVHSLFGKAFVQAYEAQRDHMESDLPEKNASPSGRSTF